ncbi:PREDICTED: uncharacterized protein LOC109147429 isoform X2 [Ipomoea nil]|uniref:uncharacterized protein LOC109147429 isoform X2 n=1 Tax=Ipomoea nil TaxID=35883 RepID=UPI0009016A9C|nr:PREDICTED: uncharacterized protein LOC109147429 isoform X2 [Ipomoea nil]
MSSWFSLPTPFKSPDDDQNHSDPNLPSIFRGVAALLSPPLPAAGDGVAAESSQAIVGIRNDLVEIGDSFKSGLSFFASNMAASEFSKLASNFLKFKDDEVEGQVEEDDEVEEEEDMIGITDEVVDFVRTISFRPQLWTDFPISLAKDFHISDNQREHVENIEQLVPSLGSLKLKLAHHLTDGQFWMIYFTLLLPRLDENDLGLLSTPEIVKVREMLLQQLRNKKMTVPTSLDREKQLSNTNTAAEPRSNAAPDVKVIKDEKSEQQIKDVEDVSFSDLEDDDDTDSSDKKRETRVSHSKKVSSSSESHEWVQLNESSNDRVTQRIAGQSTSRGKDSEGEESSDWHTVDDADFDSLATI